MEAMPSLQVDWTALSAEPALLGTRAEERASAKEWPGLRVFGRFTGQGDLFARARPAPLPEHGHLKMPAALRGPLRAVSAVWAQEPGEG